MQRYLNRDGSGGGGGGVMSPPTKENFSLCHCTMQRLYVCMDCNRFMIKSLRTAVLHVEKVVQH